MREFLEERDKVRISVVFRGRELEHPELGHTLLNRVQEQLNDIAIVESRPKQDGKLLSMLLAPKR
jgi:translation initiation factor IF-3